MIILLDFGQILRYLEHASPGYTILQVEFSPLPLSSILSSPLSMVGEGVISSEGETKQSLCGFTESILQL